MRLGRGTPSKITVAGYEICGVSVAAVETCLWVPSLSLAFDSGRCPRGVIGMRYMAVTHGHCDHIHGLPLHLATRNLQHLPTPLYFLPAPIKDDVHDLVKAVGKLEHCRLEMDSVSLKPGGDGVEFKKGWVIRAIHTQHTVPSQGYVILQKRKKLKKEFLGTPGKELARLKKDGVEVERVIQTPEIAYTGDTKLDAIRESDLFRKARVLITEMTFLDNACSPEDAAQFGHIHLDEIIDNSSLFCENEHVIFTHFSARYSDCDIQSAFTRLPKDLREKSIAFGIGA
ncbi:tRNase Z TRZ1 [Gracilariopsis chorda]|uniref:TRNase Z TRZ1 n=1 Tax=Gracilariopsis chorda TaxID=448386 RepID=A0A2V3J2Q2_9FLOR|nr:tRNase Z TRZ1 [Gracilariopsis chorda]|eukprot:PXF48654.1 tRNase Z TRZ1 [Gracilariopsis chorda]